MYTIGQPCIYTPNGSFCEIIRLYADRHRAAIKITETGREIDEVAWHDLAEHVEVKVPKVAEREAPETEVPTKVTYTSTNYGGVAPTSSSGFEGRGRSKKSEEKEDEADGE